MRYFKTALFVLGRYCVLCLSLAPAGVYIYLQRYQTIASLFSGPGLLLACALALVGVLALRYFFFEQHASTGSWKTRIKAPPGSHLRTLSEFLFSKKIYSTIFEPTLCDLLNEYVEALKDHRPWKARYVRIRGYWSFWSTAFAQLPISALKMAYKAWQATR